MPALALNSGAAAGRERLYRRFDRRNRIVGVLRLAVPLLGVAVIAILLFRIVIANLAPGVDVGGFTVSREGILVDAPRYEGVMSDGTQYRVTAQRATASFANPDRIEMENADLVVTRSDGVSFAATAARANYDITASVVIIPGTTATTDTRGTRATLDGARIDWKNQLLQTDGAITAEFADGTTLTGTSAVYDANTHVWTITDAILTTTTDAATLDPRRNTQ